MRRLVAILAVAALSLSVAACGGSDKKEQPSNEQVAAQQAAKKRASYKPYVPRNGVEMRNYNDAQEIYDDPTNILWCTFSFNNPSSPLVTVPVTGKLTSSSTTYFSPEHANGDYIDGTALPSRSVDGLFHPNPPQYRYGFTPGGAYVDFFNLETYCSNKPTEFQRQQTKVSLTVDAGLGAADAAAQRALKSGDKAGAQRIIQNAIGGSK